MARKERLEVGEATVRLLEVPAFGRLAMPPEIRRKLLVAHAIRARQPGLPGRDAALAPLEEALRFGPTVGVGRPFT